MAVGNADSACEEEPELPTLLPLSLPVPLVKTSTTPFQRLHSQDEFAGASSSDPPVFSSDDVPSDSENYRSRRKKTGRVGPWWGTSQPRKKRKMESLNRNVDSGVFCGDTGSIASTDFPSSEVDLPPELTLSNSGLTLSNAPNSLVVGGIAADKASEDELSRFGPPRDLYSSFYCPADTEPSGTITPEVALRPRDLSLTRTHADHTTHRSAASRRFRLRLSSPQRESISHRPALEVVEKAVENGVEDIDLSGQFVWHDPPRPDSEQCERLDDRIFHPLHHLVKTRSVHDPGRYDSLIPDMRLWLSSNGLKYLPNEIYRLRNLTKLGLRGNQLRTLSPAIGCLERLQYLNLRGNRISYLPWEITRLPQLRDLFIDDGHLLLPVTKSDDILPTAEMKQPRIGCIIAVSTISWLDLAGIPVANSPPRPSITSNFDPSQNRRLLSTAPEHVQRQPLSMVDMCLRSAAQSPDLSTVLAGPNASLIPHQLATLLQSAMDTELFGGLTCSICDRPFAVPRAEWLEWRLQPGSASAIVPTLRTTCSWSCATDFLTMGQDMIASCSEDDAELSHQIVWNCGWRERSIG